MTRKPNEKEIEILSAYLDNALTDEEERRLKARLSQDAALREDLENLRLTRYVLRQTPQIKRQRSFILTPEMVQKQRFAWRALNISRMVAVGASVLFGVVLAGQLFLGMRAGSVAMAPAENVAMMQEQVVEDAGP